MRTGWDGPAARIAIQPDRVTGLDRHLSMSVLAAVIGVVMVVVAAYVIQKLANPFTRFLSLFRSQL